MISPIAGRLGLCWCETGWFWEAKVLSTLNRSSINIMDIVNIGTTQYKTLELFQLPNNYCTQVRISQVFDMVNIVQD
jgi:hypothetical protein